VRTLAVRRKKKKKSGAEFGALYLRTRRVLHERRSGVT
jgi:hypothetical protein